jgi:hypothetical protein
MRTEDDLRAVYTDPPGVEEAERRLLDTITKLESITSIPCRTPRKTWTAVWAGAAAVLAVAAAVAIVGPHVVSGPAHEAAVGSSAVTPIRSSTTTSAHALHVPAGIAGVVDAVQVKQAGPVRYEMARSGENGSEQITHDLDARTMVIVDVVRASSGFDASRIPRDDPISIAGTTGYYCYLQLYPLDGAASDKYSPVWSVAFPTSDRTWVIARVEHAPAANASYASVPDRAKIVSAYQGLHLRYAEGSSRLPFRVGYLPRGTTVDSLSVDTGPDGVQTSVTLVDGNRSLGIEVAPSKLRSVFGGCVSDCRDEVANRQSGDLRITVSGAGYDHATVQRALDTLTLPAPGSGPSTWWTIEQAFS